MSDMHGKFVWIELMTSDLKAAETFYGSVLGLDAKDAGGGMNYTLLQKGEIRYAGMMAVPQEAKAMGAKPAWLGYVAVDDCDASAKAIRAAGGKIFREPSDVPGMLRFAVVADPHGAAFMIMTPIGAAPPGGMPAPDSQGTVGWRELHAGDLESDFAFYSAQFGWKKTAVHDMGPMGPYQLWAAGDQPGGMMKKTDHWPVPTWAYYFNVDALDATVERVKAGGGTLVNGPMEVPGGQWTAHCLDPQGAFFALVSNAR